MGWNEAVFRWINTWPEFLSPVFDLFSEGNKWWPVRIILLAFFVALAIKGGAKGRLAALLSLLAWPIANEWTDFFKSLFQELRPCVELDHVILRVDKLTSFGTASAHSANMAAIAFVMMYFVPKVGYAWMGIAFLTGLSRIYVGVHYPSQVLLGWTIGILVGLLVVMIYESIVRMTKKNGRLRTDPSLEPNP